MPTMAELLTPEARERLLVAPVHNHVFDSGDEPMSCACGAKIRQRKVVTTPPTDLTRTCGCERRHDGMSREGDVMVQGSDANVVGWSSPGM